MFYEIMQTWTIIGKVLNRDRSLIYHYELRHKPLYKTCPIYRDTFNKIYAAYKNVGGTKEFFLDKDFMKGYLLRNGVKETVPSNNYLRSIVLLEVTTAV